MPNEILQIAEEQKKFFRSGKTLDVKFRLKYLKALYKSIKADLPVIHAALKEDLGKSESESYMCETGLALSELSFMIKHAAKFAKPKRVGTPISQFAAKSYRLPSPYGSALVISPWNYPFLLSLDPLIDAVAAGNTVVLKTSVNSPKTGEAIKKVIERVFDREYVAVINGGKDVNDELLTVKFDYIFFTGSKRVGKLIYQKAAENLTPVTLELGGKSPCVVDETANVALAAKRIVWGKYLNLGQTCVAPDYIYCSEKIYDRLVSELKKQIEKQFTAAPLDDPDYGKIVNERHFNRLLGLIDDGKVLYGGQYNDKLQISPTVIGSVSPDDAIMQEEIFGPLLPIMTYKSDDEAFEYISSHDAPLALYIFSKNKKRIKKFTTLLGFGGGCVNDVVIHLATSKMPFGGFKESGLGGYHGKFGFDTFSHYKSIVNKRNYIDLPMRYQPYKKSNDKLVRFFLK